MRTTKHTPGVANGVAKQFSERWSSRSFDGSLLSVDQIHALLGAARLAPSSYNDQPWHFYYSKTDADRDRFLSLLADGNRTWAQHAGALFFLAARRMLSENGMPNRHYAFDAGAAWMSLALQAHTDGLSAHAMGGFNEQEAYAVLGISPDDYEILVAIAVGKPVAEAVTSEERTQRKPLTEIST